MSETTTNVNLIIAALVLAEMKHPTFCEGFTYQGREDIGARLAKARVRKRAHRTCDSVIAEELYEALEAHEAGNLDGCMAELAQCGAVILRMMQFVQGEIDARDAGSPGTASPHLASPRLDGCAHEFVTCATFADGCPACPKPVDGTGRRACHDGEFCRKCGTPKEGGAE